MYIAENFKKKKKMLAYLFNIPSWQIDRKLLECGQGILNIHLKQLNVTKTR